MTMKPVKFLLICFILFGCLARQLQADPVLMVNWLGMDLQSAYKEFGTPREVFCYRGDKADEDNVVFYYNDHIYLFWFENRVWTVRFDERYEKEFMGVKMGAAKEQVLEVLGSKYEEADGSLVFYLPDRGFPVRLRLFFRKNKLYDAYLYRGDY